MMISLVATFWLAGNVLTAGLAWAIIPSNLGKDHEDGARFNYESWRVFVAFCMLPSATSVITFILLPESPKFLLEVRLQKKKKKRNPVLLCPDGPSK